MVGTNLLTKSWQFFGGKGHVDKKLHPCTDNSDMTEEGPNEFKRSQTDYQKQNLKQKLKKIKQNAQIPGTSLLFDT